MITITETATQKLGEYVADAGPDCRGVRVRAIRVGRYTFRYQMQLVREQDLTEGDVEIAADGCTVYLDPQTAEWMEGATVDYLTLDSGEGFQIDNPAAAPAWEDPVARRVQEVIDAKVLPVVGAHGGWVELDRIEGSTAFLRLGGGCQGCASASFTLKEGIEKVIVAEVPEIEQVVDETNHTPGSQPHYR